MTQTNDLIDKIGDRYFYICPTDDQNKDYPRIVNISDAEGEILISIQGYENSLESAEAMVNLLNGVY